MKAKEKKKKDTNENDFISVKNSALKRKLEEFFCLNHYYCSYSHYHNK